MNNKLVTSFLVSENASVLAFRTFLHYRNYKLPFPLDVSISTCSKGINRDFLLTLKIDEPLRTTASTK